MFAFRCSALDRQAIVNHRHQYHKQHKYNITPEKFIRSIPEGYSELYRCPDCKSKGFTHQDMLEHWCELNKNTDASSKKVVYQTIPLKQATNEEVVPSQAVVKEASNLDKNTNASSKKVVYQTIPLKQATNEEAMLSQTVDKEENQTADTGQSSQPTIKR